MSSTFVADTTDDNKSDNTLIIIVNNDGTISVDQETLQNLLANQQNTAVSVVRVGAPSQGDDSSQDSNGTCDSQNDGNPHVNLTVEGFYPPPASTTATGAAQTSTSEGPSEALVDPFLEMDPEQLERLETALQSEQAKQILGENVTAMLGIDMLSVEEETAQLTDSIRMDHCYTNLSPSSAPATSTPNHQYGPVGSSDTDTSDNSFEQEPTPQPVVTTAPVLQSSRARGRGRGPGRPRREANSARASQSYRGASARGTGRGVARTGRGGTPGMVMVQQIKSINPPLAPPPSSPSSASLVPLIKPLVMTDRQQITTAITSSTPGQVTVQKQVVAVPVSSGGTRLVTLTGTKLGQVVGGNRVLLTTNRTLQQHQLQQKQQQQRQLQQQKQQKLQMSSVGQDATVTTSNEDAQLSGQQELVSSSVLPGMTVAPGEAKVLVAKMPTIPPQLLGAQPSTGLTGAMKDDKLPDNEADFTHFPGREEENEDIDASDDESDEQDVDDDDDDEEYIGPGARRRGRFGSKYRGGNRRMMRGTRARGSGRAWDRGGARGQGKIGVKRRGGRGRGGHGRSEDIERAQRLEAEMAAALAAMDQSPEKETLPKTVGNERVEINKDNASKAVERQEGLVENLDSDIVSPLVRKKAVKVYGKGNAKKKMTLNKDVEGKESEVTENKKTPEKIASPPSPEKKMPIKSPVRKHSTESSQTPSSTSSTTSTPTSTEVPKLDRKNYPKRENRKPPAHLAEALGPALFSTPDIIRRVSTGSEQKTPTTPDTPVPESKKATSNVGEGASVDNVQPPPVTALHQVEGQGLQDTVLPEPSLSDDLTVPEDQSLLETLHAEATKTEEELLADALLLQQHIGDDGSAIEADTPDISKPMELDSKSEEVISSTNMEVAVKSSEEPQSTATKPAPKLPSPSPVATRSARRRGSNVQDSQPKKEVVKPTAQKQQTQVKERRKSDDNKNAQTKGKPRNRSSEMETKELADDDDDEESEAESSDDESWNSEDDPDRLWCICKKPHNNRFMICCDSCEDWFHGKCVGVTKSIGKQMEENGLEWVCPNCTKKKEAEGKDKERDTKKQNKTIKEKDVKKPISKETVQKESAKDSKETNNAEDAVSTSAQKQQPSSSGEGVMFCIVCKKEARPTSIYCSDACILKHAQESLSLINKEKPSAVTGTRVVHNQAQTPASRGQLDQQMRQQAGTTSAQAPSASQAARGKSDARVIVFERKTGRLLAGPNAPTAANLKTWLKDNPTFEVVRPGVMPTTKFYNQKAAAQQKQAQNAKLAMQSKLAPIQPKTITPIPNPQMPTKTITGPTKSVPVPQVINKLQSVQPGSRTQKPSAIVVTRESISKGVLKSGQGVKSPTSTPKTILKPAGNSTITPQISKPSQSPTISKAPATSTVKEVGSNKNQSPVIIKKVEVKRSSSTSSTETPKKEEEKPAGPEPIRINVRKTLQELLQSRIHECSDLIVAEEEIQKIALNIEEEMHAFFRDTGIKYKSKYRSLVFNIKDPKNLTLFRKIADKSVTPHQLVRLSPEELASQELAQWREREAKHQLEMIKKNELDLMALSKTYVMKTHKGEQVIETDESMKTAVPELVDPASVPDIVSALNDSVSSTVEDTSLEREKGKNKEKNKEGKDREKRKDDKDHISKDRDKSSKRDEKRKGSRERERSKDKEGSKRDSRSDRDSKHSRERGKSSSKNKHHHHHHSSERDKERSSKKEQRDEDRKKEENRVKMEEIKKIIKEEEKAIVDEDDIQKSEIKTEDHKKAETIKVETVAGCKVEEDSDLSDREPSSTVIIKTPDINVDDGSVLGSLDLDRGTGACATVWKGFVNMPDVAKFFTTVQVVSGDSQNLCKDLPDTVDIVGRIIPETVWDYISKMKKSGTKEILVIRLTAANDEEKIPYIALYTYLNSRNRLGVVGNVSKMIKDFYIMPLASHNPVPQVLLPLDGPGFEDYRPHLLLGILVRARRKRLAPELTYVAKVPKRPPPLPAVIDTPERSYTPPLPGGTGNDVGNLTPPHPPPAMPSSESYTPPHSPKQISIGTNKFRSVDPRLNRKTSQEIVQDPIISEKKEEELVLPETIPATPTTTKFNLNPVDDDDDDDAPYSPGGGMDEDNGELSEDNLLSTPKNPTELQRKMEELNRKIEEQKQQIQCISSAIGGTESASTTTVTVPGVETLQMPSLIPSYMTGAGEEVHTNVRTTEADAEDENEAYSPSRSFTPPTSDSIPFIGGTSDPTTSVLSAIPSDISLPSNLSEILASIKKRESDGTALTTNSSKGINLKEDPIVQNYTSGNSPSDLETAKVENNEASYVPQDVDNSPSSSSSYNSYTPSTSSQPPSTSALLNTAASSIVPALLSLSTPVVHPLSTKSEGSTRDPRQKQAEAPKPMSTLSSLSDDELLKKAMEMEAEEKNAMTNPTLQQPLPPGVDSFPVSSATAPPPPTVKQAPVPLKSLPSGQPLPPGLEDEEYPSYSSSFPPLPPSQAAAPPHGLQPLGPPPPQNVSFPRHPNPVGYHIPPPHYNPPPPPPPPSSSSSSSYNMGPPAHVSSPQGGNFNAPFVSASPVLYGKSSKSDEPPAMLRNKRKFQDVDNDMTPEKRDQGREPWDKKVPVPVRGHYNPRPNMRSGGGRYGNRGHHSQRGFMRPRGRNGPPHRTRWMEDDKSHYDANIHSEWDSHIKEFEEKRTREKQRVRERDRPSMSSRLYSRSNKSRSSDKGSDNSA